MKILYFASLREELNCSQEDIEITSEIKTVDDLKKCIVARGKNWEVLGNSPNLRIAVNQELAGPDKTLVNSDEIAFFPPVTGG